MVGGYFRVLNGWNRPTVLRAGKRGAADPLECSKCKGPMGVIALIEDPQVIRRILERLGLWAPLASERSPPFGAASWPGTPACH